MENKVLVDWLGASNFIEPATPGSVGFDLKARDYIIDWRRNSVVYLTDVSAVISDNNNKEGWILKVYPRSSVYKKKHLGCMANSVGIIDRDYTGRIMVIFRLQFRSWIERMLAKLGIIDLDIYMPGDRVAQAVITKVAVMDIEDVRDYEKLKEEVKKMFPDTNRFENGFGSTGK